jgi:outer membrane lipoprotein-sorting protein
MLALSAAEAQAQPEDDSGLSPDDAHTVSRVINYLQALSSARARFTQTDARGTETTGVFYLQRPGRARFDYDAPSGLVIATDGHDVAVVDRRLKTIQTYPLNLTPLAFFLAENIRLDRGVKVSRVTHEAGGFTIVAEDAQKKTRGSLALNFSEAPLTLTGWTLVDGRGSRIRVRLSDFAYAAPKDADFFTLVDPHRARDEPH